MTLRTKLLAFVPGLVAGVVLVLVGVGPEKASAYHTNFQAYCNNIWDDVNAIKRSTARAYAYVGRWEGYQWGGGCWNDNNEDDSPNDPREDPNTNGEGGDCSGFTFKSWYLRRDTSDAGFRWHHRMQNTHGPYTAAAFKDGIGAPNVVIAKAYLMFMDALASDWHIGMIYSENADGTDDIIEAKGEGAGTGLWVRSYRASSSYGGVRRRGWLPECYPQCA